MANAVVFGTMPDGAHVHRLTLAAGDLTVSLLTLGSTLQSVRLAGVDHDLTIGSDRLDDYLGGMAWFGSLVGPVANRIAGARAVIAGREHQFQANQAGKHALHSGSASLCHKLWLTWARRMRP
jgi:aldose 1-epimerase